MVPVSVLLLTGFGFGLFWTDFDFVCVDFVTVFPGFGFVCADFETVCGDFDIV
jgi:hypothetical protein